MINKLQILLFGCLVVFLPSLAKAFCPVCTIAVGAGLGLSRYLKVDDAISGIWIGALLMSSSLWFAGYLKKKKVGTLWAVIFVAALYAATFVPLHYYSIIGHPSNTIYGLDRLIFGAIIGTIFFPISASIHKKIKSSNKNKSYFPMQSVVIPIVVLLLSSLAMYVFLTRIYG